MSYCNESRSFGTRESAILVWILAAFYILSNLVSSFNSLQSFCLLREDGGQLKRWSNNDTIKSDMYNVSIAPLALMADDNSSQDFIDTIHQQDHSDMSTSTPTRNSSAPLRLVICATVRDGAPYLSEWIEYHRMIGFSAFLIMNDKSTDDTQCILDAYAKEGIVVRVPADTTSTGIAPYNQHTTFQACTEHLSQQIGESEEEVWMSTHDVDEFLWFNRTQAGSLKELVRKLAHGQVQSFAIPRHLFGSSGHLHYDREFVMSRFTHRYAPENCPNENEHHADKKRRMLLNHLNPKGYCDYEIKRQFDNYKSMSLVSALAKDCYTIDSTTSTKRTKVFCHSPHTHQLIQSSSKATSTSLTLRDARENGGEDPRYMRPSEILDSLVIMHYMIRSKAEFFQHICSSRFFSKYYLCKGCNPQTHFDFTETYSNLLEDRRMIPMFEDLKVFMKESGIETPQCNVEPPSTMPWEYYQECFKRQLDEVNNKDR